MMMTSDNDPSKGALVLRPAYVQGESAADHLIRAFHVNGVGWGPQALKAHRVSRLETLSLNSGAAAAIAKVIGRNVDGLSATTPSELGSKYLTLGKEVLHRDHWTTEDRRWCPACWREDQTRDPGNRPREWNIHRRFWWGCTAISHCPIHNVRLERQCYCGRPVLWYVGNFLTCQNGHSLLDVRSKVVDDELVAPDRYIGGRLGATERLQAPLLDQLPLHSAIEAITRFGVAALGGADLSLRAIRTAREPEMMAAGYQILMDWPGRLIELLDRVPRKSSRTWGSEKRYGQLYRWVRELPDTPFGNEVRKVFFGHIGEKQYVKPNSAAAEYVGKAATTVSALAAELGMTSAMACKYLAALGIDVPEAGKGFPAPLHQESVGKIKALFEGRLILKEAADFLGIGRRHVHQLIEEGCLADDPVHKGIVRARRVFLQRDLDALVERATNGLSTVTKADIAKYGLWSLPKALRSCQSVGMGVALRLIQDGLLRPMGVQDGLRGLAAILTTPSAISQAARRQSGGAMTCQEAADVLQLHPEDVRLMVKAGVIEHQDASLGRIFIPKAVVSGFASRYVGSRVLASTLGVRPNMVALTMRKAGKRPAFDRHRIPGLRGSVYERFELQNAR